MIGYLFCDLLQICGGVSMCFGVKRLFTVHGLHRLPRKYARLLRRLGAALAGFVTAQIFAAGHRTEQSLVKH